MAQIQKQKMVYQKTEPATLSMKTVKGVKIMGTQIFLNAKDA
jgi:hypothetical protein